MVKFGMYKPGGFMSAGMKFGMCKPSVFFSAVSATVGHTL